MPQCPKGKLRLEDGQTQRQAGSIDACSVQVVRRSGLAGVLWVPGEQFCMREEHGRVQGKGTVGAVQERLCNWGDGLGGFNGWGSRRAGEWVSRREGLPGRACGAIQHSKVQGSPARRRGAQPSAAQVSAS